MRLLVLLLGIFVYFGTPVCSAAYYTFKMVEPIENHSLKYNDENVYISFGLAKKDPDRLFISIHNKTDEAITVKWLDTSLIFSAKAHMVLPGSQIAKGLNAYSGVKDAKIPPNTTLEESLFAEGSIIHTREPVVVSGGFGHYRRWGGWVGFDDFLGGWTDRWKVKPFFPTKKKDVEQFDLVGEILGVYLVLEMNEQQINKRFDFAIEQISTDQSPGSFGAIVADKDELAIKNEKTQIQNGVLIVALAKKSAAKDAGLQVDDNIIKIDGKDIENGEAFATLLNNKKAKDEIKVTYLRKGKENSTVVKLRKI